MSVVRSIRAAASFLGRWAGIVIGGSVGTSAARRRSMPRTATRPLIRRRSAVPAARRSVTMQSVVWRPVIRWAIAVRTVTRRAGWRAVVFTGRSIVTRMVRRTVTRMVMGSALGRFRFTLRVGPPAQQEVSACRLEPRGRRGRAGQVRLENRQGQRELAPRLLPESLAVIDRAEIVVQSRDFELELGIAPAVRERLVLVDRLLIGGAGPGQVTQPRVNVADPPIGPRRFAAEPRLRGLPRRKLVVHLEQLFEQRGRLGRGGGRRRGLVLTRDGESTPLVALIGDEAVENIVEGGQRRREHRLGPLALELFVGECLAPRLVGLRGVGQRHPRLHIGDRRHDHDEDQQRSSRRRKVGSGRVPPPPAPPAFPDAGPADRNRLVLQEAGEIVRQFAGRLITVGGLVGDRLHHDRFEVDRQRRKQFSRGRDGRGRTQASQRFHSVVHFQRHAQRRQLVERHAQAVDVAAGVGRSSPLFRSHIEQRAQNVARAADSVSDRWLWPGRNRLPTWCRARPRANFPASRRGATFPGCARIRGPVPLAGRQRPRPANTCDRFAATAASRRAGNHSPSRRPAVRSRRPAPASSVSAARRCRRG